MHLSATHAFGVLLKQLRKQAGMTQRDLAAALGYSDSLISSLEKAQRLPDLDTVMTRFISALGLQHEPAIAARLIELAAAARGERPPATLLLQRHMGSAIEKPFGEHRDGLPAPPSKLIGRDDEVQRLCQRLPGHTGRLLTLIGPPGIGKTQLALAVAACLERHYADGARFVPLAAITDASTMAATIAASVSGSEASAKSPQAQAIEVLRRRHMLLVLDNCEQIIAAAPLVAELLAACPRLTILATSRERLHLRAEQRYRVPPLQLAAAVDLFAQRAAAIDADFASTAANRPLLEAICQQLDCLPLALELCAARVDLFTATQILAQLRARPLDLLVNGAHDLPPRHRTLRHAIQCSFELLAEHERTLFRRLGVFVGGWSLAAMAAVCSGGGDSAEPSLTETLHALIGKSLVRAETSPSGERRFLMLETIREYAVEQLAASSEAERLHHQHACYFLALSKHGAASQGPDDGVWAIRLNHEYDNLRSALGWSYSLRNDSLMVLELTNALVGPWWERGLHHEMQLNLERALSYPPDTERTAIHATAHLNFANLLAFKGKYSAARTQFVHALVIWQALGDHQATAWMLNRIGWLAREQGDTATAALQLSESLAIFRSLGDTFYTAQTLNTLAGVAILQEDPACAEALLAESRALNIADPVMQGWALNHLGHAAQLRKEYSRAFQLHQESLSVFPRDYKVCLTWLYHALGETMLGLEQLLAAADWFTQGLTVSQELHDQASLAWCLAGLGSVAAHDAVPERAARLWAAAEQLRSTIGCRPAPAARASYERAVASVRAALGEQAFALAWQQGRALTLEQAIAEAFEQRVQRERGVFQQVLG